MFNVSNNSDIEAEGEQAESRSSDFAHNSSESCGWHWLVFCFAVSPRKAALPVSPPSSQNSQRANGRTTRVRDTRKIKGTGDFLVSNISRIAFSLLALLSCFVEGGDKKKRECIGRTVSSLFRQFLSVGTLPQSVIQRSQKVLCFVSLSL